MFAAKASALVRFISLAAYLLYNVAFAASRIASVGGGVAFKFDLATFGSETIVSAHTGWC